MAECSGSVAPNNVNTQKQSSAVQSTDSTDEDKTDKVMEPLLLEDLKRDEEPRSVINLYEFFKRTNLTPTKNDVLTGLVYILMLESGFVPAQYKDSYDDFGFNYQRLLKLSEQLPDNWKRGNVYVFSFVLPGFDLYECKVACVITSSDLLVNCTVRGIESVNFSVMLDPLTYFSSSVNATITKLQNTKGLSTLLKDKVFYPLKQTILQKNSILESCFESLPDEIVLYILEHVDDKDLLSLRRTCKFLSYMADSPSLWVNVSRRGSGRKIARRYVSLREFYIGNLNPKHVDINT